MNQSMMGFSCNSPEPGRFGDATLTGKPHMLFANSLSNLDSINFDGDGYENAGVGSQLSSEPEINESSIGGIKNNAMDKNSFVDPSSKR